MRINPHTTELSSGSRIAKSSKEGGNPETREQVKKLRETAIELEEENLALREEIKRLREKKAKAENLEFHENVYWLQTNTERLGPFCPRCYTEHQSLATLLDGRRFVGKTRWICPVCNHVFDSD